MTLDPIALTGLADPYPVFAEARKRYPVSRSPDGVWNVTRYADCVRVLRDVEGFSSDLRAPVAAAADGPASPPQPAAPEPAIMGASDPPDHDRLRALVAGMFTAAGVAHLDGPIRATAVRLLSDAAPAGQLDIVAEFGKALPIAVVRDMLGIPVERTAGLARWSDAVTRLGHMQEVRQGAWKEQAITPPLRVLFPTVSHVPTEFEIAWVEASRARAGFDALLTELMAERRVAPCDDLVSALVAAVDAPDSRLSDAEARFLCFNLLTAGHETTAGLIGNVVLALLEQPEVRRMVQDNRTLVPALLDEVLRFSPPVQAVFRRTTRDCTVGGQTIEAGSIVYVWLASANRDEQEHPRPDEFALDRRPNRHLGFGFGLHHCLGAPLTRLIATIAVEELLQRLPDFRRAGDATLRWIPSFFSHGVVALPVAFAARPVGTGTTPDTR
jgi:cytochrome P450